MSWVKLDDAMPDDEKVANLSDTAWRCYVTAICWSSRNLMDGRIPERTARLLAGKKDRQVMSELVPLLWHEPGVCCESEHCAVSTLPAGQLLIHNYLKYNPTKEKVLAEREKARRRKFAGSTA